MSKKRYGAIDALRGFSILLMILHHWAFDLLDHELIPAWLLYNPVVEALHIIFASVFIAISGACSSFSPNNIKRGIRILAAAAVVTVVTFFFDREYFIRFGILHFLGFASLIYAAAGGLGFLKKISLWVWAALFALSYPIQNLTVRAKWLFPLGLRAEDFYTFDWFPLIPWIFMYLFGAKLGEYISRGKMPERFYSFSSPFLEWVGRRSLWIYLLHQPVLLGLTWCLAKLL